MQLYESSNVIDFIWFNKIKVINFVLGELHLSKLKRNQRKRPGLYGFISEQFETEIKKAIHSFLIV